MLVLGRFRTGKDVFGENFNGLNIFCTPVKNYANPSTNKKWARCQRTNYIDGSTFHDLKKWAWSYFWCDFLWQRLLKEVWSSKALHWSSNTLDNNIIRCNKLATIVSGQKYVTQPFVRQKQVSTSAEIWQQRIKPNTLARF